MAWELLFNELGGKDWWVDCESEFSPCTCEGVTCDGDAIVSVVHDAILNLCVPAAVDVYPVRVGRKVRRTDRETLKARMHHLFESQVMIRRVEQGDVVDAQMLNLV